MLIASFLIVWSKYKVMDLCECILKSLGFGFSGNNIYTRGNNFSIIITWKVKENFNIMKNYIKVYIFSNFNIMFLLVI